MSAPEAPHQAPVQRIPQMSPSSCTSAGCSYMSPSSARFLLAGTLGHPASTRKLVAGVSSAGSRLQSYDSYNPLQLPPRSPLYNYTPLTCHTPPSPVCTVSVPTLLQCRHIKEIFTHFLKAELAKWAKWCKLVHVASAS